MGDGTVNAATVPMSGVGGRSPATKDGATAEADGDAVGAPTGGADRLARIPTPFRGTWARTAADCGRRGQERVTVTGEEVRFFESGGPARDIRRDGSALAVTYPQGTPDGRTVVSSVYFALEGDGAMRVRRGEGESRTYRRCPAFATKETAAARPTVPARFRGLYALDRKACAEDYSYAPAFQNVTVKARDVNFFETGGPVTDVNAEGDSVAITLRETVGDGQFTRAIYLALNDDGTVRYRPGSGADVKTYVRCGGG